MFYFLANSCYKENCYFKMYLVLLLVKCEEDKNRFQKGVEKDLIALSEESIPVNTRQKAMWAYRLYEKWAQWRKDAYDPRVDFSTVGDLLMIHTELAGVPDHDVNELLCQFIAEVRKDGGERYPGKTLHELVSSLQKYFEMKGRKVSFFSDEIFEKLRKSLDIEMKISAQKKLGLKPRQAVVVSEEIENFLWDKSFLGNSNPEVLLRTTFYLIGLNFGMRAGDEHRKLSSTNFSFHTDSEGREYLLYSEGVSKTNQGGLKHRKLTPRSSRAYANAECPERCVVRIVDTYMKRCSKDSLLNAFYLKPLQKFKGKSVWYSTVPLGHNKLNSMVKTMMSEAGVEGYYTNHSLRATAVSRLFQNDVDDKLIKGVTGHRSEALQGYKRETEEQLLKVSKIVQGQKEKESTVKGNSNSALTSALEIPSSSGTLVLNICGGNCNITINNN